MTLRERFDAKWTPEPMSGCYLWTSQVDGKSTNRAKFYVNGRWEVAGRTALALAGVQVPPGMLVCHRCDNPACVNPAHLFVGTTADNVADKTAKGRQPRGERHGCAKLTASQVEEIRRLYAAGGVSQPALGARFGVTHTMIGYIVRRKNWAGQRAP